VAAVVDDIRMDVPVHLQAVLEEDVVVLIAGLPAPQELQLQVKVGLVEVEVEGMVVAVVVLVKLAIMTARDMVVMEKHQQLLEPQ
jgi:hypothetical protein